ncbi:MAG: quinolinate synthase NadA [Syntrophobacterales bacterium]|jgi:quinolinate synthase|nr:quinolinate synthase NadA [Syntrophobacterales bacterium]
MPLSDLQKNIVALLRQKKAILLAHYYQRREVQEIADILGDSLSLCIEAAKTDAEIIVFAGVHFMAESAAILCPDKTVLIPRPDAGCPLADMITPEQLQKARQSHPEAAVVTYINSSAAIKALSDICCTSANALNVVHSIKDKKEILFIPDGNLARYTALSASAAIIPWEGYCPVHQSLNIDDIIKRKADYPGAPVLAHPECTPDVLRAADFVGSTAAMLEFVRKASQKTFIIATETGILVQMGKENPGKTLIPASENMICETMKYTTLEDIYTGLTNMTHIVTLPEDKRLKALSSLEKMLALAKSPPSTP